MLPITVIRKLVFAGVATALAVPAPAGARYGWPLKPFGEQHAVRGYFGDPRITGHRRDEGTLHFGIDIVGANGSPVYATLDGVASGNALHADVVRVSAGAAVHEYWHVVPAVRAGQRVVAFRTIVGRIESPWGHVHFSETVGGVYVNPLRPDGLSPYRDRTRPTVGAISFERNGKGVGTRISGIVDVVAEAWDDVPIAVPAPWHDKPVAPALVEWRLTGTREPAASRVHVAADFRLDLPTAPFTRVYAPWTRQNHPWERGGRGRYRFYLAANFDTRTLPNGIYRVVVVARDSDGNARQAARSFTVANGA